MNLVVFVCTLSQFDIRTIFGKDLCFVSSTIVLEAIMTNASLVNKLAFTLKCVSVLSHGLLPF